MKVCQNEYVDNIIEQTPYLQYFSTTISCIDENERFLTPILYLTKLTLLFRGSIELLINLFQYMINLYSLTFYTSYILLNGHQWKDIFMNYLPNLKKFQLKMIFQFFECNSLEDNIDELLDTFQTDFWLNQHQWFVRCGWNLINPFNQAILYTLPYNFEDFDFINEFYSKSTCINSSLDQQCQTLIIDIKNRTNIIDLINQMSNLQSLTLQCKDDKWNYQISNDELIQWLKEHLTKTCEIFRHKKQNSILQIWIQ